MVKMRIKKSMKMNKNKKHKYSRKDKKIKRGGRVCLKEVEPIAIEANRIDNPSMDKDQKSKGLFSGFGSLFSFGKKEQAPTSGNAQGPAPVVEVESDNILSVPTVTSTTENDTSSSSSKVQSPPGFIPPPPSGPRPGFIPPPPTEPRPGFIPPPPPSESKNSIHMLDQIKQGIKLKNIPPPPPPLQPSKENNLSKSLLEKFKNTGLNTDDQDDNKEDEDEEWEGGKSRRRRRKMKSSRKKRKTTRK